MSAPLELYILTFNCARSLVNPAEIAPHIFRALPQDASLPDMVMFSLQEIAPIAYSFLGGSYLTPYFDQLVASLNIASKIRSNGSRTYKHLLTRNVGMTAMMLFATSEVAERVQWMQTAGVGVGHWEMGNKGAVGVRLGYELDGRSNDEDLEITLVAAHLAPMEDGLSRRNQDWMNIVRRLVFSNEGHANAASEGVRNTAAERSRDSETEPLLDSPSPEGREVSPCPLYSTKGHVFFAGDLNYRTSKVSPLEDAHLSFPQPTKPEGDPQHISEWLKRDQLSNEMEADRTLHGFTEVPITFPPTYKYQPPSTPADTSPLNTVASSSAREPDKWHWAKHRFPSWCDRILYLPSSLLHPREYKALPLQSTSDHRPVALSVSVKLEVPQLSNNDIRHHPPFQPDPQWKSRRENARRLELIVGTLAWLIRSREGQAVLVGLLGGAIGGYYLIRSLL